MSKFTFITLKLPDIKMFAEYAQSAYQLLDIECFFATVKQLHKRHCCFLQFCKDSLY